MADEPYETVKQPAHYGGDGKYEVFNLVRDWGLGFFQGNALKYICRAGKKPGVDPREDIRKAIYYCRSLPREIHLLGSCLELNPYDAADAHRLDAHSREAVVHLWHDEPFQAAEQLERVLARL